MKSFKSFFSRIIGIESRLEARYACIPQFTIYEAVLEKLQNVKKDE